MKPAIPQVNVTGAGMMTLEQLSAAVMPSVMAKNIFCEQPGTLREIARESAELAKELRHAVELMEAEELREEAARSAPIRELGLSLRALKCCIRLGVSTIQELASKTPEEVYEMRNCGRITLGEIQDKLALRGMSLAGTKIGEGV